MYSKKVETVKLLVGNGADLLVKTRYGNYTILHIACRYCEYALFEYLLNETALAH